MTTAAKQARTPGDVAEYRPIIRPSVEPVYVDFCIVDQKGRDIGFKYTIRQEGDEYEVWGTPTRNREGYGPAFNRNICATLTEAEQCAARRVAQSRKANTKKFASAALAAAGADHA